MAALAVSQGCWDDCFFQKPYTSLWMIHYLLAWVGKTWEDYVQDPTILEQYKADLNVENGETTDFEELIGFPGRCTSFALQTVEKIEAMAQDGIDFDFQFYGFNCHRVARSRNTEVLIDSSSSAGAFVLEEGEWKRFDAGQSWKWEADESKFDRTGSPGPEVSSEPLSRRECMVVCLRDLVADSTKPLCLFRDRFDGEVKFFGMIEWQLQKNRILLAKDRASKKDLHSAIYIVWDGKGDAHTESECRNLVDRFPHRSGAVFSGAQQWQESSAPHWRIWDAANKAWGFPRAVPALIEDNDDQPLVDYEVEDAVQGLGLNHFQSY